MKVLFSWLKDYVDINQSPYEVADRLTISSAETTVEKIGFDGTDVVIGQITKIKPHPHADRLQLATVKIGTEELEVVCGAKNIKVGQKIPFAKEGARLPSGIVIKEATIRGIISKGMICSATELALEKESEGILILSDDAPIGRELSSYLKMEYLLDLEVLPNRPDLMSVKGVARELSALYEIPFKDITTVHIEEVTGDLKVKIANINDCHRYVAVKIDNVRIEESPDWVRNRLYLSGIKPINLIVDLTNYVMMEMGQPLHVFDADKIKDAIEIRRAKKGEQITALDQKNYILSSEVLIISDVNQPIACAGIIGGLASSVSEETTNIILESAYFDPVIVRKGSKKISLRTEAVERFEKQVDAASVFQAAERFLELLKSAQPQIIIKQITDNYSKHQKSISILFDPFLIKKLIGSEIDDYSSIFLRLGLVNGNGKVNVPSFRSDITKDVDLVDEIIRVKEYKNIVKNITHGGSVKKPEQELVIADIGDVLSNFGWIEAINYSFLSSDILKRCFFNIANLVRIKNPLKNEREFLRPSLIPGLIETVESNIKKFAFIIKKDKSLKLFEIGNVYHKTKELFQCALVFLISDDASAFANLRGMIDELSTALDLSIQFKKGIMSNSMFSSEVINIINDGKTIGHIGKIITDVDINGTIWAAELELEPIIKKAKTKKNIKTQLSRVRYKPFSIYPPILNDISLIVPQEIKNDIIINSIKNFDSLITNVELFDEFINEEKIGKNKKSIALHIVFSAYDRTLKGAEVEKIMQGIYKLLEKEFNAQIRKI